MTMKMNSSVETIKSVPSVGTVTVGKRSLSPPIALKASISNKTQLTMSRSILTKKAKSQNQTQNKKKQNLNSKKNKINKRSRQQSSSNSIGENHNQEEIERKKKKPNPKSDTSEQPNGDNKGEIKVSEYTSGRWTEQEHSRFLAGLAKFGKDWRNIANFIKTRTYVQTRTHAQKYFKRVAKERCVNGEVPRDLISTANDGKQWGFDKKETENIVPSNISPNSAFNGVGANQKGFGLNQLSNIAYALDDKSSLAMNVNSGLQNLNMQLNNNPLAQLQFLAAASVASNAQLLAAALSQQAQTQTQNNLTPDVAKLLQQVQDAANANANANMGVNMNQFQPFLYNGLSKN